MLRIKVDTRQWERGFDQLARKVLPQAMAQTLNAVGAEAIKAERQAEFQQLDRPTPFTTNQGLRLKLARKTDLEAVVYIPPIQSHYLAPEIEGGLQVLSGNSQAILRPINQATNQYGNIPRNLLARLRGRPDVFVGRVKGVDGVWQRLTVKQGQRHARRLGLKSTPSSAPRLKLLIRFSDPVEVKTRYRFGEATLRVARQMIGPELQRQLRKALTAAR
jgi:hypothetical protein